MSSQLIQLFQSAVVFGTVIMFGAIGEILTEKSGNLNLGVPGIMYLGGIAGLAASFFYELNNPAPNPVICLILSFTAAFLAAALGGLLYSFLTITLRTNQNVTGLTLTIFGGGIANFFGGGLNIMAGGVGQISVASTSAVYCAFVPGLSGMGVFGQLFFHYGFMVYLAIIIAIASTSPSTSTLPPASARASPDLAACTTPWITSRAPGPTMVRLKPWAGWPWRW